MKKTVVNTMATTGAALVALTIFAVIIGGISIYVHTILEILAANIVIHFGLFLIRKFESSYAALAYFFDISYLIADLVVFGVIFDSYSSVPVWVLIIVGVAIYLYGLFTNMVRIRNDIKEMDELLQKRKGKNTDIVT
jgi:uncharacterized membrane protein YqhA